ncbi:MAG TPA: FecR domain-containing protein [Polyangiales bacterium]
MTTPDELDEALRAKLRTAAEQAPAPEHSDAYQARLVRTLHARTREPAPQPRHLWWGAAAGVALVAAAALLVLRPRGESAQRAQPESAEACGLPTALAFRPGPSGTSELLLGKFGELRAEPGSQLRVVQSTPCLLSLELSSGFVAGDLAKLKPAQLRVRTPHGTVVIRGTRFSVRSAEELEVVLLSGRVDIENGSTHVLEPQQVFRTRGKARQRVAAQPDQARRIAQLLAARGQGQASAADKAAVGASIDAGEATASAVIEAGEVAPAAPTPALHASTNSRELLARAESARRNGRLEEARALYAQASAGRDGDAEVALLRWSRLELDAHDYARVAQLLSRHARRFDAGSLHAEAAWLRVSMLRQQGDLAAARRAARELIQRFPRQPQAEAAEALLREP